MTVLGSLLAVLAGLLRDLIPTPQLAVRPEGLTASWGVGMRSRSSPASTASRLPSTVIARRPS